MLRIRLLARAVLIAAGVLLCTQSLAAQKQASPEKRVKQAEARLKALIKEGEDRPSVYEARLELVKALAGLESCDANERIESELGAVAGWLDRTQIPVRVSPQLVHNEIGRAAQTRAACTDDPALHASHHEAALRAFSRATELAHAHNDALTEAIAAYNAAHSAEALGDLPRAIALLERACAIDLEHALHDNYREDYATLVRLRDARNGTITAPEKVEAQLASLQTETVRFAFKPVHGDRQRYHSEMSKVALVDGERHERKLEVRYAGTVAVQGEVVTISMIPDETQVAGRPAKAVAAETGELSAEDLVARLLAQPLSFSVKTDGEYIGATGLEELRRTVLARVDAAFDASTAAAQREQARQLIERVLSDAVVNQQIATEWTMAVGWWIDAELELGSWYSLDVQAPQALQPGATLAYQYLFKVNRRIPCGSWDTKRGCVELIIEGRPDRRQLAQYLYAFMESVIGSLPRKQAKWFKARLEEDVELLERHVLIVDPGTLKTHHQLRSKTTYIAATERGGQPRISLETTRSDLQVAAERGKKRDRKPANTARTSRQSG